MSTPRPSPRVYAVAELTQRIKALLEHDIGFVQVEGECSNVRRPASGHLYFTLKDADAQISAVFFRGSQRDAALLPTDGAQVKLTGSLTVYPRGGNYQVIVQQVEPAGIGALQQAFEALKRSLHKEGLFSPERKRPLPVLPQRIGIVTSPTGAAIRDILQVIERRFPRMHVIVAPTKVQGPGAADEIAQALEDVNRLGVDVIICGRGGGSIEDLWAFNEEPVARAIAASTAPVISAVGHEIDTTIADYVADLRAPTPSAAAELVIAREEEFAQTLDHQRHRINQALLQRVERLRARCEQASQHYVFREPDHLVAQFQNRVERAQGRLTRSLTSAVQSPRRQLDRYNLRLPHALHATLPRYQHRFEHAQRSLPSLVQSELTHWRDRLGHAQARLRALDPKRVLERGFSLTTDADGRVVSTTDQLAAGKSVVTRLANGTFDATVDVIHPEE